MKYIKIISMCTLLFTTKAFYPQKLFALNESPLPLEVAYSTWQKDHNNHIDNKQTKIVLKRGQKHLLGQTHTTTIQEVYPLRTAKTLLTPLPRLDLWSLHTVLDQARAYKDKDMIVIFSLSNDKKKIYVTAPPISSLSHPHELTH